MSGVGKMIHMLSRFDLKPGTELQSFASDYYGFFERAKELDLAVSTGKIGRRVSDTPMDTDAEDAQEYYVIMSFRDREQLDRAYDYMDSEIKDAETRKPHSAVKHIVRNSVFTCWQD